MANETHPSPASTPLTVIGGGGPEPYDPGDYAPTGPEDDDIPF